MYLSNLRQSHRLGSLKSLTKWLYPLRSSFSTERFHPLSKVLIANRGEIACRIIRTANKLGIRTVAVYSEEDAQSLFVRLADEAYCIGAAPTSESYLRMDRIIEVAKKSNAKAIHPGYGFLSENADFVDAVEKNGLIFIGPTSASMRAMGDKINSKRIAQAAGCFIIPGFEGEIPNAEIALEKAELIGFPLMLKASAGGGGKGMRVVHSAGELREAFELCQAEASSSFGDKRLLLEKYVENPHHIEIQVLADSYGNVIAFPERECSVQRRNQKVIEESPSCLIDSVTRLAMQQQAIALCKATSYRSAGTVEMLCDDKKNFYFLEMNTRLQVEHPVTELVSGEDLVHHMFNIAVGKELPTYLLDMKNHCVTPEGWAMEARVYAEDPLVNFMPSTGPLLQYKEPVTESLDEGGKVRVDSGVFEGYTVSPYYDPMLAKLCSYGKTRAHALSILRSAIDRYQIQGPRHNLSFLRAVTSNKSFISGDYCTSFIPREFPNGYQGNKLNGQDECKLVAIASAMHYIRQGSYYNEKADDIVIQLNSTNLESGYFHASNTSTTTTSSLKKSYEVDLCLDDDLPPPSSSGHSNNRNNNNQDSSTGSTTSRRSTATNSSSSSNSGVQEESGGSGSGLLVNMRSIHDQQESNILVLGMDWRIDSSLAEITLLCEVEETYIDGNQQAVTQKIKKEETIFVQYLGLVKEGLGFRLIFAGVETDVLVLTPLQYELDRYSLPPAPPLLSTSFCSPMTGTVKSVEVREGQRVDKGQPLFRIEAMKMQNVLRSERSGLVSAVLCKVDDKIMADQPLLKFSDE